ncbi:MAG: 23S rRNA (uracil(1939)-C(5))-methyltransferase RlmD [Gammaproteobacteria bacterium]|nr:23S rRNA (uracil(1939)-C(5))-methyltransferase RlmD [Gammaproteobacteria bacterium]
MTADGVRIESLAHEGRGVAHIGGKTTFVDGALPGELASIRYLRRRGRFDEATAVAITEAAVDRVAPGCPHYGVCGGCSLQHLAPAAQIAHKQRVLLEQLGHIGGVAPGRVLEPLLAPVWGYRRKARLGVKWVPGKGGALVGFRERGSAFITALTGCEVLHPAVGRRILALRELIGALSIRDRIPQLEVAVGEDDVAAIIVRHLAPLATADRERLAAFGAAHGIDFYLQPDGPGSVHALVPGAQRALRYRLPAHDVEIHFEPADFTQVSFDLNRRLVDRVVDLLAPAADQDVLDLYCGLGNFTLPLARRARRVCAFEGDAALVARAQANAARNGIANVELGEADLAADLPAAVRRGTFAKVLLDPPRSGAEALVRELPLAALRCLVYVSCNPATLARDAGILVGTRGLELVAAGVMDMFPHTTHVESIAVFAPRRNAGPGV